MKKILIILTALIGLNSFGQVSVKTPSYWWVSKFPLEDLQELAVGSKILFVQNCARNQPAEVTTGVTFYENVYCQKERFSMAIEFKDTVIVSVTYYLKAQQYALLGKIGYPDIKAKGSAVKGQWTYTLQEEKRRTTIVGDKKRIVVVQTI